MFPTPKEYYLTATSLKSTGFAIFLTTLSFLWGLATKSKMNLNKMPNLDAQPETHLPIFFFSLEESTPIELSPMRQKGIDLTEPKREGSRILINLLFTCKCV